MLSRGMAMIAPQKPLSDQEINDLMEAEASGFVLILAVGKPDSAASERLLSAHDLKIDPRPLGTIPSASNGINLSEQPRFLDAWPINATRGRDLDSIPGLDIIFRNGSDTTMVFRHFGKGGLLLVSDTRFFSMMNVEDMAGQWLPNIALIHDMFERYLHVRPELVKPLFPSPIKPE